MNRIKQLREEKNITQQELADKINGAKSTIAMYEKGTRKPSMQILIKLSDIFDCSIDYLLGKSDVRKPEIQNEDLLDLAKVGFTKENYNPPSDKQKEQIRTILETILEDNKKDNKNDNN